MCVYCRFSSCREISTSHPLMKESGRTEADKEVENGIRSARTADVTCPRVLEWLQYDVGILPIDPSVPQCYCSFYAY